MVCLMLSPVWLDTQVTQSQKTKHSHMAVSLVNKGLEVPWRVLIVLEDVVGRWGEGQAAPVGCD